MTANPAPHPRYHFAPAANWLSDPNGLVHDGRRWHLFYQYNPFGEDWGHMSWGHAVSPDLARWQERPVALAEDTRHMIFSGSAVVDPAGRAGFGKGALVAAYTGAVEGRAKHQSQCLAYSTDHGEHWTKFAGNPVLDRHMADFRDPNLIWHEPSGQWVMTVVLSAENRALLYGSGDLRQWTELSEVPTAGAPGHLWECPLLVELPVEGEAGTHWLFKVDVLSGAPGSGALYLTGQFDGTRFVPDGSGWQVADWGRDFYAAIAWHEPRDARGRPAWIGWLGNHAYQGRLPHQGWRGAMSLPRRLGLRRTGAGLRLVQQVEPACDALFAPPQPIRLAPAPRDLPAACHLRWTASAGLQRLAFEGQDGRRIGLTAEGRRITVTRHDPVTPGLDTVAQVERQGDGAIDLWLDHGSFELLTGDGATALTLQHRLGGNSLRVSADSELALDLRVLR
ncbi:MAG: glycoside hydrolase family 32 protein [Sphingomonadales bacterium]|nr:glycoside hydrolase family 32 protein [Sphingomonadales bacterium]